MAFSLGPVLEGEQRRLSSEGGRTMAGPTFAHLVLNCLYDTDDTSNLGKGSAQPYSLENILAQEFSGQAVRIPSDATLRDVFALGGGGRSGGAAPRVELPREAMREREKQLVDDERAAAEELRRAEDKRDREVEAEKSQLERARQGTNNVEMRTVLDALDKYEWRSEHGPKLGNLFMKCPTTRAECGAGSGYERYLDTVVRPMSLTMMRRRLDEREYGDPEDFAKDAKQIVQNAQVCIGVSVDASCFVACDVRGMWCAVCVCGGVGVEEAEEGE